MSLHNLSAWQHHHQFVTHSAHNETRTRWVMWLSALTMVAEIAAGWWFESMALLADGWHMATHIAAFAIALMAYRHAREHAHNQRYTFGTGKVAVLGGFASAIVLLIVALLMAIESLQRIYSPGDIAFDQAIVVAVIGLLVNLTSAFLLQHNHSEHDHGESDHDKHDHADHTHEENHEHEHHHHHDHSFHASYMHVIADAMTSVLAIAALLLAKYSGLLWLDPLMAVIAAVVITRWSYQLLKETAPILLDATAEDRIRADIVALIEGSSDNRISDLHVWRISAQHYAAIIAIVSDKPASALDYKQQLSAINSLAHITIEVQHCSLHCGELTSVTTTNTAH